MEHVHFVWCGQITPGESQLSQWPPMWLSGFTCLTLPRDPILPSYSVRISSPWDEDKPTLSPRTDFDHLSGSVQTTTSCFSARLFSGRCLRRRTERPCDCWLEIMLRSAAVWIPVPSTSSSLSITSFTAGHKKQRLLSLRIMMDHLKMFHSCTV